MRHAAIVTFTTTEEITAESGHVPDEKEALAEQCEIVEKAIALYRADGMPLPPPTAGHDFANSS